MLQNKFFTEYINANIIDADDDLDEKDKDDEDNEDPKNSKV